MKLEMLSPRREAFALQVAGGKSAAAAYRMVYPRAARKTAETAGPALARKYQVRIRIQEFREKVADIAVHQHGVTKQCLIRYLLEIVETPIGEVDENHRLCQRYTYRMGPRSSYRCCTMPSKLAALKQLAKLCGFDGRDNQPVPAREQEPELYLFLNYSVLEQFGRTLSLFPEARAAVMAGLATADV
jgi:hypothetical protein